jgi:aldehyde:ferredoxin oxidoreductase
LPERLLTEVLTEGPAAGKGLTKKEFDFMKNEYYSVMGWDENGIPTDSCLSRLGLT